MLKNLLWIIIWKKFDSDVFASNDEYEDNNVPNYDLFNKHVFDIFQQVETLEFAYTVVVSKWNVLGYHFPTITDYLVWRKKNSRWISWKNNWWY